MIIGVDEPGRSSQTETVIVHAEFGSINSSLFTLSNAAGTMQQDHLVQPPRMGRRKPTLINALRRF